MKSLRSCARMTVKMREFRNWPGGVRRKLMGLTLREFSGMRQAIQCNSALLTWVLFEGKNPVAWSLVEYDTIDKKHNIMIYVRRDRRRLGYGRRVFTAAKRWVTGHGSDYFIYPDPQNHAFFKSMGERQYGI